MLRQLFDDTHELFRESFRSFVHREVKPYVEKWERDGIVDRDLFRKAGAAGFLGMAVPESLGGSGVADFRFNAIMAEELGVNLLLGGHYATETFGVKALAACVGEKFGLPWQFIDHPTGL